MLRKTFGRPVPKIARGADLGPSDEPAFRFGSETNQHQDGSESSPKAKAEYVTLLPEDKLRRARPWFLHLVFRDRRALW